MNNGSPAPVEVDRDLLASARKALRGKHLDDKTVVEQVLQAYLSERKTLTWRRQWPYLVVLAVTFLVVLAAASWPVVQRTADRPLMQGVAVVIAGLAFILAVVMDRSPDRAAKCPHALRWSAAVLGGLGLGIPLAAGVEPLDKANLTGPLLFVLVGLVVASVAWLGVKRPSSAAEL